MTGTRERFARNADAAFGWVGRNVARRPHLTVLLTVLVTFACSALLTVAEWETSIELTYVPRSAESFPQYEDQLAKFGQNPRRADILVQPRIPVCLRF
jgi:hypothetical protein